MVKVKRKPHNGLRKRFTVSSKGKPRYKKSFAGHLMSGKSGRRKMRLRRKTTLTGAIAKNICRALCAD